MNFVKRITQCTLKNKIVHIFQKSRFIYIHFQYFVSTSFLHHLGEWTLLCQQHKYRQIPSMSGEWVKTSYKRTDQVFILGNPWVTWRFWVRGHPGQPELVTTRWSILGPLAEGVQCGPFQPVVRPHDSQGLIGDCVNKPTSITMWLATLKSPFGVTYAYLCLVIVQHYLSTDKYVLSQSGQKRWLMQNVY